MEAICRLLPPGEESGTVLGVREVDMSEEEQQRRERVAASVAMNAMENENTEVIGGDVENTGREGESAGNTLQECMMEEDNSMVVCEKDEGETGLSVQRHDNTGASLFSLPDELISMCYDGLSAKDLTALECVNRRLRDMVSTDSPCWRTCVKTRYSSASNATVMDAAAVHAGGWKKFYAEKVRSSSEHAPWVVPSLHETMAIIDLIKGRAPSTSAATPCKQDMSDDSLLSNSPSSIMQPVRETLCVVLLIDGSSSVTEDDFGAMKDFTKTLIVSLRSTHPNAAIALIQFNQYPRVELDLTTVSNTSSILEAVDLIEQMMGSTDIAAPIRRARHILNEHSATGEKAIILLSDGQTHADELEESEKEARTAAEMTGARVFALGVGRDVDEVGLTRVAHGSRSVLANKTSPEDMCGAYFTLRRLQK